jgi:hypothetical protein
MFLTMRDNCIFKFIHRDNLSITHHVGYKAGKSSIPPAYNIIPPIAEGTLMSTLFIKHCHWSMKESFFPCDVVTRYLFGRCQDTGIPHDSFMWVDMARREITVIIFNLSLLYFLLFIFPDLVKMVSLIITIESPVKSNYHFRTTDSSMSTILH